MLNENSTLQYHVMTLVSIFVFLCFIFYFCLYLSFITVSYESININNAKNWNCLYFKQKFKHSNAGKRVYSITSEKGYVCTQSILYFPKVIYLFEHGISMHAYTTKTFILVSMHDARIYIYIINFMAWYIK